MGKGGPTNKRQERKGFPSSLKVFAVNASTSYFKKCFSSTLSLLLERKVVEVPVKDLLSLGGGPVIKLHDHKKQATKKKTKKIKGLFAEIVCVSLREFFNFSIYMGFCAIIV